MVFLRRLFGVLLLLVFCISLCSCTESDTANANASSAEHSRTPLSESTASEAYLLKDTERVIIVIDKREYSIDEEIEFEFRAENEGEGFEFGPEAPDGTCVQYWDGSEWKKCKKQFNVKEYGIVGADGGPIDSYKTSFLLSERADEGKEKYRLAMDFTCGTFYSEEFTIE